MGDIKNHNLLVSLLYYFTNYIFLFSSLINIITSFSEIAVK